MQWRGVISLAMEWPPLHSTGMLVTAKWRMLSQPFSLVHHSQTKSPSHPNFISSQLAFVSTASICKQKKFDPVITVIVGARRISVVQRCQLVRFARKPYRLSAICTCLQAYDAILTDIWFLTIQTYNHSTPYIRTVVSLQWHQLCFMRQSILPLLTTESTKLNLCHNKLCFVSLLYMGVLQCDPMPKLCFVMVLTICKDFLQIVR